ncbi:MAG: hypothetical protein GEU28_06110 [Dehalococcoidia bacterium]|nr:hypothetical protein [Dehalococcoidia bacterium]
MAQIAEVATKKPIVPFLEIEDGSPYLKGVKCPQCGTYFLGERLACSKCSHAEGFEPVKLSTNGEVYVYSIVHQSFPGAEVPFVAAIVDLPEGVPIRCNIRNVEPTPEKGVKFGMKVEMKTGPVEFADKDGTQQTRKDKEGNEVIAFWFEPAKGA